MTHKMTKRSLAQLTVSLAQELEEAGERDREERTEKDEGCTLTGVQV